MTSTPSSPPSSPSLSETGQKYLAIAPKVAATFSIIGGIYIIQHVLRSPKRRGIVFHRIMLAMSSMDLLFAITEFLGTWIMPAEIPNTYGNVGSTATCTAFGYLGTASSLTSVLYSATLTIYFLLTIRFGCLWGKDSSRMYEILIHVIPVTCGWGIASSLLPMQLYNPMAWDCWVAAYPIACELPDGPPCERGAGHSVALMRNLMIHLLEWISFTVMIISLIIIYCHIEAQERRSHRLVPRNRARDFARQASLYVFAFFLTTIIPLSGTIMDRRVGMPFPYVGATLRPLIGFFNCVIYVRPRMKNRTGRAPHDGWIESQLERRPSIFFRRFSHRLRASHLNDITMSEEAIEERGGDNGGESFGKKNVDVDGNVQPAPYDIEKGDNENHDEISGAESSEIEQGEGKTKDGSLKNVH